MFASWRFSETLQGFPLNTIREFPCFLPISYIYEKTRYNTNQRVLHRYEINIHAKGAIMLIRQLECFCAVCETGSFTKAAGLLYVTQSAVSQQISSLEKELRVNLFKREGRVLSITEAGSLFYQKCRMILNDIDDAVSETRKCNESAAREYAAAVQCPAMPIGAVQTTYRSHAFM